MNAIITITDIRELRRIPNQVEWTGDFENYVIEAQRFDIRPFLGDAMFYDMMENLTSAVYVDLLDGTEWTYAENTIQFDGLRVALAYFSFARYIQSNNVFMTRYGLVTKSTEHSEPVDEKTIARLVSQARNAANAIIEQAKLFLNNNIAVYTLWNSAASNKPRWGSKLKCITNYD